MVWCAWRSLASCSLSSSATLLASISRRSRVSFMRSSLSRKPMTRLLSCSPRSTCARSPSCSRTISASRPRSSSSTTATLSALACTSSSNSRVLPSSSATLTTRAVSLSAHCWRSLSLSSLRLRTSSSSSWFLRASSARVVSRLRMLSVWKSLALLRSSPCCCSCPTSSSSAPTSRSRLPRSSAARCSACSYCRVASSPAAACPSLSDLARTHSSLLRRALSVSSSFSPSSQRTRSSSPSRLSSSSLTRAFLASVSSLCRASVMLQECLASSNSLATAISRSTSSLRVRRASSLSMRCLVSALSWSLSALASCSDELRCLVMSSSVSVHLASASWCIWSRLLSEAFRSPFCRCSCSQREWDSVSSAWRAASWACRSSFSRVSARTRSWEPSSLPSSLSLTDDCTSTRLCASLSSASLSVSDTASSLLLPSSSRVLARSARMEEFSEADWSTLVFFCFSSSLASSCSCFTFSSCSRFSSASCLYRSASMRARSASILWRSFSAFCLLKSSLRRPSSELMEPIFLKEDFLDSSLPSSCWLKSSVGSLLRVMALSLISWMLLKLRVTGFSCTQAPLAGASFLGRSGVFRGSVAAGEETGVNSFLMGGGSALALLTGPSEDSSADSRGRSLRLLAPPPSFSAEFIVRLSARESSSSETERSDSILSVTRKARRRTALTEQNWRGNSVGSAQRPSLRMAARSTVTLPTSLDWSGLLLETRLSCTCVSRFRNRRWVLSQATSVRSSRSSLKSVLPPCGLYLPVSTLTFWLLVRHCTENRHGKRTAVVAHRTDSSTPTENADLSAWTKFIFIA